MLYGIQLDQLRSIDAQRLLGNPNASPGDVTTIGLQDTFEFTSGILGINFITLANNLNTDMIAEGISNLYYTPARARSAISLTTLFSSGAATYNSSTGALNIPHYTLLGLGGEPAISAGTTAQYWRGDKTWQNFQTDVRAQLSAGTGIGYSGGVITNNGVTSLNGNTGALTGYLTGSGTSGYIPRRTGSTTMGDSQLQDDATNVGVGGAPISGWKMSVYSGLRSTGDFMASRDNFNSSTNLIRGNQWITLGESFGVGTTFSTRCASGDTSAFYWRMGANNRTESASTIVMYLLQDTAYRNYLSFTGRASISMDNSADPLLRLMGGSGFAFTDLRQQFVNSFNIVAAEIRTEDMDVTNKQMLSFWTNGGSGTSATALVRRMTIDGEGLVGINRGTKTSNTGGGYTGVTAQLHLQSGSSSRVGTIFMGASSQTADISQWQDSSASILAKITAAGALELASTIKTAQPSVSGAGVYKFGKLITGATVALDTTKYVEVEIDGAIVKLGVVS